MSHLLRLAMAFRLLLGCCAVGASAFAGEDPRVSTALVLAVDVSASVTPERYELQKQGIVRAFTGPGAETLLAGGLAVTIVEWSGSSSQKVVVPWTILRKKIDADKFASQYLMSQRAFSDFTSISAAVDFSVELLDTCACAPVSRVIDVSGDGANNSGRSLTDARGNAIEQGVIINGLPIMGNEADLDQYYDANVKGGEGSFIVVANGFEDFERAIRLKLLLEVASR